MTEIAAITLEVADPAAAASFYAEAFPLNGSAPRLRESQAPSRGFRGFTLSLTVAGPSAVDSLIDSAVAAGASVVKPAAKSLWGYGGVVQAPDGSIWKIATSSKKDKDSAGTPAPVAVHDVVLLLGVDDVVASKKFYVEQGLTVARSFGRKYVEFASAPGRPKVALYGRKALAKDAGVPVEGTGSHRIRIGCDGGTFTDPDGFAWEAAA